MLEVKIKSLLEGAREAEGIAVIIDVFRAGTNISLVLDKGAEKVIPVSSLDYSFALMQSHPEYIFMGERNGTKIPEFNYGNSPSEMDQGDFSGKTVSINTTSGTQGIANATKAGQIIIGGFANSPAIESYIQQEAARLYDRTNAVKVTIVPMGWAGETIALEDEKYAIYLRDRLLGMDPSFKEVKKDILCSEFVKRFFNARDKDFPEGDLEYCLTLGRFNNVPKVYRTGQGLVIYDALKHEPERRR